MPYSFYLLSLLLFVVTSCEKDEYGPDVPDCVVTLIEQPADGGTAPQAVYRWEVDGDTYFYVEQACCDQFNLLYDTNCTLICAPDGGITGSGQGDCPEFAGEIERTLIWGAE